MDIRESISVSSSEVAPQEPIAPIDTPTETPTVVESVDQPTETVEVSEQVTEIETEESVGEPIPEETKEVKPELSKEERQALGKKIEKKIGGLKKEKALANEKADNALKRLQEANEIIAQLKSQKVDTDSMSFEERIKHSVDTQLAESRAKDAIATATDDLNASGMGVWQTKLEAAQSNHSDYAQVVGESKTPMKPDVATAIKESDLGAEMVYQIAKNPELGQELYRASPMRAAMILQTLEQSIGNSVPTEQPQSTPKVEAPVIAPTPKLNTSPVPSSAKGIADMGMEDFMAMKQKQFNSNRRG